MRRLHVFEAFISIILAVSGFILIFLAAIVIPEIIGISCKAPVFSICFMFGIVGVIVIGILLIEGAYYIAKNIFE